MGLFECLERSEERGKKGRWDRKGISERCWIRIGDHDRRAATYFLADTSGLAFLRGWWARKQDNEGRKPFHRLCMRFSDSLPRSSQRSADVLFALSDPFFASSFLIYLLFARCSTRGICPRAYNGSPRFSR